MKCILMTQLRKKIQSAISSGINYGKHITFSITEMIKSFVMQLY